MQHNNVFGRYRHAQRFNNITRRVLCVSVAAILLLLPATASAALIGPTVIALSGTAAPAGGNYRGFISPVLNDIGQVAYQASITGGSSSGGIFAGTPGSVQVVGLDGTAAPAGGNYNGLTSKDTNLVLSSSGEVVFRANLTGGSSSEGLFSGLPGSMQAVALRGMAAPAGGNYGLFNRPVLNGSGQVAYVASLTGGSSNSGIFSGPPGSVQAVALQGMAAPTGGNYSGLGDTKLNRSGQVAYSATLSGGSSSRGIFAGTPGSIQAIALQGTATPVGGNYNSLGTPVLNSSGQVAYVASITGGSSNNGIFTGTPGSVHAVALQGMDAPAGGKYGDIYQTVLHDSGQVAFQSSLSGGSSLSGIFAGLPGSLQAIVLEGTVTPEGVGNFASQTFCGLNGAGQVAFLSYLSGPGVTSANSFGLYAGSAGNVKKIVRYGDIVDLDTGVGVDLRTVTGISVRIGYVDENHLSQSFNDDGLLIYKLSFSDGSSGIFTSQITPIPEPATWGILVVALFAFAWQQKRRRIIA